MIASRFRPRLLALAASVVLLAPSLGCAANFTYHVDLNVATLVAAPASGPYSLDFQLNGDGVPSGATNAVTVNNFVFTLGNPTGTATTFQGATGNLNSGVFLTLNSNNTFNEFYQGFSATTTDIQFDVTTTGNGSGITPDTFLVQILNGSLGAITTNAPDGVSLLSESINGAVTLANINTYSSTNPAGVTTSAVPEPSAWAAMLLGVGVFARTVLRRRFARA